MSTPEETAPYGSGPNASAGSAKPVKRIRTHHLREMKERGEKITMLSLLDRIEIWSTDDFQAAWKAAQSRRDTLGGAGG